MSELIIVSRTQSDQTRHNLLVFLYRSWIGVHCISRGHFPHSTHSSVVVYTFLLHAVHPWLGFRGQLVISCLKLYYISCPCFSVCYFNNNSKYLQHKAIIILLFQCIIHNKTFLLLQQFALLETLLTAMYDTFPRSRNHKILLTGFVCLSCFLMGIPLCATVSPQKFWICINFSSPHFTYSTVNYF